MKHKLDESHVDKFRVCMGHWQQRLNMLDWRIEEAPGKATKMAMAEVQIDPDAKLAVYRVGRNWGGTEPSDTVKHEALLGVMACDKAKDWGETKHRYWYTGHVHHQSVKEFPGVVCESFRTLAAKDAYAAGHGYRAGRDMVCITHHKNHGEVERHRVDVGMLQ